MSTLTFAFLLASCVGLVWISAVCVQQYHTTAALRSQLHTLTVYTRTDQLTGLASREWFHEYGQHMLASHTGSIGVVMCDLDGFKALNDRFGHHVGDRALIHVAHTLQRVVNPGSIQAIAPETLIARLGGDEFALLLRITHDTPFSSQIHAQLSRVREEIITPSLPGLGMSVGFTVVHLSGRIHEAQAAVLASALRAADRAMYLAKTTQCIQEELYSTELIERPTTRCRDEKNRSVAQ